jgi:hypothetical protein
MTEQLFKFTADDVRRVRGGERIDKVATERHLDRVWRDYLQRIERLKN